jgi:hypothetical protein
MKRVTCFQDLGEMVQPAEDAMVVISNGLSISGEMIGVGGTRSTRTYIQKLLIDLGFPEVEIYSMDLKFSGKGYNFMSVSLSSALAAEAIINYYPHQLGGKSVTIKPAIIQPKRNMSRPTGNAKAVKQLPSKQGSFSFRPNLNPDASSFKPRFTKTRW